VPFFGAFGAAWTILVAREQKPDRGSYGWKRMGHAPCRRDARVGGTVGMAAVIVMVVMWHGRQLLSSSSQASAPPGNTGFMSTTGVPSTASRGLTRRRVVSAISNTRTRCNPMGFGRSGDRVAKTPVKGLSRLSRG